MVQQRQARPTRHSLKRASITEFKMGKNRSASMFHESRLREERRESSMKSLAMKDLPMEMLKKMNSSKHNNLLSNVKIPEKNNNTKVMLCGINLSRFVIAADASWKSRWDWSVICLVSRA